MSPRPRPAEERFWAFVNTSGDCWEWAGSIAPNGYGKFSAAWQRPAVSAHRYSYMLLLGAAIPPGMHVDHLCRNRRCVSPAHLELVTPAENLARRPSVNKVFCNFGHRLSGDNLTVRHRTGGGILRNCRTCVNAQQAERARVRRAALKKAAA